MEINCYDNLAEAIIEQAVLDYKENLLKIKRLDNQEEEEKPRVRSNCKREIRELEKFFKSSWYDALTYLCDVKISGREILAAVKGNVEKEAQKCPN